MAPKRRQWLSAPLGGRQLVEDDPHQHQRTPQTMHGLYYFSLDNLVDLGNTADPPTLAGHEETGRDQPHLGMVCSSWLQSTWRGGPGGAFRLTGEIRTLDTRGLVLSKRHYTCMTTIPSASRTKQQHQRSGLSGWSGIKIDLRVQYTLRAAEVTFEQGIPLPEHGNS